MYPWVMHQPGRCPTCLGEPGADGRTRLSSHQPLFSLAPLPSSFSIRVPLAAAPTPGNGLLSLFSTILGHKFAWFNPSLSPSHTTKQHRHKIMPGSPRASTTSSSHLLLSRPRPASPLPPPPLPLSQPPPPHSPPRGCLVDACQGEEDAPPILQVLRPLHTPLPCFAAAVARVRAIAAAASFCSGTSSMAATKGGGMTAAASVPPACSSSSSPPCMPASVTPAITTVQRKLDWKRVCLALVQEKKGDASVSANGGFYVFSNSPISSLNNLSSLYSFISFPLLIPLFPFYPPPPPFPFQSAAKSTSLPPSSSKAACLSPGCSPAFGTVSS